MQIVNTLKCNFACRHCLFSCSPSKTSMLSTYTLQRFMENFAGCGDYINYCGGETFLNPDWAWQLRYLSNFTTSIRIVTNGSKFFTRKGNTTNLYKEFIEVLEEISCNCEVVVLISDDEFHREFYYRKKLFPLESVIRRFKLSASDIPNVIVELDSRDRTNHIIPVGRALRTNCYTANGSPFCDVFEPTLMPNGDVKGCCNGRMNVGDCTNTYSYCLDNFDALKKPENCLVCKHR